MCIIGFVLQPFSLRRKCLKKDSKISLVLTRSPESRLHPRVLKLQISYATLLRSSCRRQPEHVIIRLERVLQLPLIFRQRCPLIRFPKSAPRNTRKTKNLLLFAPLFFFISFDLCLPRYICSLTPPIFYKIPPLPLFSRAGPRSTVPSLRPSSPSSSPASPGP